MYFTLPASKRGIAEVETSYPMTTDRPIEVLTNEDIEDRSYPNPTN